MESHFAPMDVVSIVDSDGREFARGIANCASGEAESLSDKNHSRDSRRRNRTSHVLVTRDNIVLIDRA